MRTHDITAYSWRGRLCVRMARSLLLGRWPCMIDLNVREKNDKARPQWERQTLTGKERGWRYPRGTRFDLYKVTYIVHVKSRVFWWLKKWMVVTKMREFSVKMGSWWHVKIWGVLIQKLGLWVIDDKNYGIFSKEWGPRVKVPHWIGVQKECTWRRPWYVSAQPRVDIHLMTV